MASSTQRPLRVDAARNAGLLVRAAWRAFNELGTEVPLDEIAKRAGVGVATLYRRFPTKDDLLVAIMEWRYAEEIAPAVTEALADDDPWRAMTTAVDAALRVAEAEHVIIRAVRTDASMSGLMTQFFTDLATIMRRAQDAGVVRPDLRADDMPMVFFMVIGAMRVADPVDSWRRCLGLLLDGMRPDGATPLPEPVAFGRGDCSGADH